MGFSVCNQENEQKKQLSNIPDVEYKNSLLLMLYEFQDLRALHYKRVEMVEKLLSNNECSPIEIICDDILWNNFAKEHLQNLEVEEVNLRLFFCLRMLRLLPASSLCTSIIEQRAKLARTFQKHCVLSIGYPLTSQEYKILEVAV